MLIQRHGFVNNKIYIFEYPFVFNNFAVESGITEVWELAEHFDVTEDFIRDALRLYTMEGTLETAN